MSAPKVVAKGAGLVALRIREIGAENNVPTLEARRWRERCIDMRRLVNKSRVNYPCRTDFDPVDLVDDGAATARIHTRPVVYLQYCLVDHGVAGGDVYPAHA
uniref:Uncharacterized protein n=1 Tax=Panagrolaimus superbus TaxID=310955 RepID=A0A914Z519_9BILA